MSAKLTYSKQAIEDYVKLRTSSQSISDFNHSLRVYQLAKKLGSNYDEEILHAACFLHDISVAKDHEKRSAELASRILSRYMDQSDIYRVSDAILNHTALGQPKSVEAILVHDADLLDYLGAIGFVRLALAAVQWQGLKDIKDILKYVQSMKEIISRKLVLKQSKSLAADKLSIMDMLLEDAKTN